MDAFSHYSVLAMGCAMACMSLFLLMLRSVAFQEDRDLYYSRNYLSVVFMILSANCILHGLYHFRETQPSVGVALDISSYFLAGVLAAFAYFPLVDTSFRQRKSTRKLLFLTWGGATACLWVAALVTYGLPSKVLLITGAACCVVAMLRLFADFVKCYQKVTSMLTDTDYDNVEAIRRFLYSSILLITFVGLAAIVVSMIAQPRLQSWFNVVATFMLLRIGMAYVNYVVSLK